MAEELKVNEKTISRYIKEIPYIKYVGKDKMAIGKFINKNLFEKLA